MSEDHWDVDALLALHDRGSVLVYRCVDAVGWPMRYLSPAVEKITGYPASHFLEGGRPFTSIMAPGEAEAVVAEVDRQLERGTELFLQYRIVRADGDVRWLQEHSHRITLPDGVAGFEGVMADVTDRRMSEIALNASERRHRLLAEALPVQVWSLDHKLRPIAVNAAARAYFGEAVEELGAARWRDWVHPDDHDHAVESVRRAVASGERIDVELRLRGADGRHRWHALRVAPDLEEDGTVAGWLGTSFDIDELRAAREVAEREARSRDDLLVTMSHELRTPMNAIVGMAQLLEGSDQSSEQQHWTDVILRSSEHLMQVAENLLDHARLQAGAISLTPAPTSIPDLVAETVDLVATAARDKHLNLRSTVDEGVPEHVFLDAGRLRQVLLNFLSNAIAYTDVGTVSLHVGAQPLDEDGRWELTFAVTDTGPGIALEDQRRLFAPFTRLDHSRPGTGLGLAISHQLAVRLGGRTDLRSAPGDGSTFSIVVPVPQSGPPRPPVPGVEAGTDTGLRILVADDSHANRLVLREMTRRLGHTCECVEDGLAAIDAQRSGSFDLLLIDLQMPVMNGIDAMRHIRAVHGYARPAIVAVTADTRPDEHRRARDAGADDVLTKPVRLPDLERALATWAPGATAAGPAPGGRRS